MKNFGRLERQIFSIKPQVFFTKNFFKDLHDQIIKKPEMITRDTLEIPKTMLEKYKLNYPIPKITEVIDGNHYFNSSVSHMIKETFGVQQKKQERDEDEDEFKTNREMMGVLTRKEFKEKYPDKKLQESDSEYDFVPTNSFSFYDFCLLSTKYPSFNFLLNPFLIKTSYSTNTSNSLQRIDFDIKRKVTLGDKFGKKVTTKYSVPCTCGKTMLLYPNDIHTTIKHECGLMEIDGKEKVIRTTLDKSGLCPVAEEEMFLYECKIPNIFDNNKLDTIFFYSFNDDLKPGLYEGDVWNVYIWDSVAKKYVFYPILLGSAKKEIVIDKPLLIKNHPEAIKYCEERNLPYASFLDVLFSWRDICWDYGGRKINNKGMLLQLFLITSALSKILFNYDKLGISVVGNKSLSKTYTSYLAGACFDIDFEHIGSSQDVSIAGLRGGVNNNKPVNGQVVSMFEKGVFSYAGLTLFDEGEKFFEDKDMNMVLKSFLDTYIDIKKIGAGQKIEQSYTPLIMSNFTHSHSEAYAKAVRDTYEKLIKLNNEEREHGNSKEEIITYIADINLYLPIDRYVKDYKNQTLSRSVAFARYVFNKKQVDWRTGGSMPASYRLLLDVVCWNVDEFSLNASDRVVGETESVLPSNYIFPTLQFVESLKRGIGGKCVNIKFENDNSASVVSALDSISRCVDEWFLNDGKGQKVFLHLSEGRNEIDPKLNSLVYKLIKTLQCYEDLSVGGKVRGVFSDNVKDWVFLLLSKCKRGVTRDEYNFEEHYSNIVPKNENFSKLEAEIEKIRTLEYDERLESAVERKMNKKEQESLEIIVEEQESLFDKT